VNLELLERIRDGRRSRHGKPGLAQGDLEHS